MTLFLFGLTSGATVLTIQYLGKSDKDAIEKIYGIAVKTAVFVTAFFIMAELLLPGLILKIFTSDPAVIAEGIRYLRIVAFSYVMIGITQAYLHIMRSVERVIYFIFGLFGLPLWESVERRWVRYAPGFWKLCLWQDMPISLIKISSSGCAM